MLVSFRLFPGGMGLYRTWYSLRKVLCMDFAYIVNTSMLTWVRLPRFTWVLACSSGMNCW